MYSGIFAAIVGEKGAPLGVTLKMVYQRKVGSPDEPPVTKPQETVTIQAKDLVQARNNL